MRTDYLDEESEWEPRVSTPERIAWQQAKNREAIALCDALRLGAPVDIPRVTFGPPSMMWTEAEWNRKNEPNAGA